MLHAWLKKKDLNGILLVTCSYFKVIILSVPLALEHFSHRYEQNWLPCFCQVSLPRCYFIREALPRPNSNSTSHPCCSAFPLALSPRCPTHTARSSPLQ